MYEITTFAFYVFQNFYFLFIIINHLNRLLKQKVLKGNKKKEKKKVI